ncbi:MAG: hypothetical protein K6T90_02115 [Leptolyngbyaceae cyanobacterium HOT.MB2.61]|nr:hypothetical protein [Leptolyngbyaceae cyanobacterium HOT.MB2.61]
MRRTVKQEEQEVVQSPEYLRGYRDGQRDRLARSRALSGDGILGALLAIALIAGIGYFGYNYATTGQFFPDRVDFTLPELPPSQER